MVFFKRYLQLESVRNFARLFSSSLIAQGMSFALAPLFSRLYTPEDFGLVALYLGIFSIASVVATARYEQAIMLPASDQDARSLGWLVMLISLGVALISLLIIGLFHGPIIRLSGNAGLGPWLYVLPPALLLHGLYSASTFYANRSKQFGLMARNTVWQYVWLNMVRLGAGLLKLPANGLVLGQLAGQISAAGYISLKLRKITGLWKNPPPLGAMRLQARIYSVYPRFTMIHSLTNNLSGSLPIFLFTWGFSPAVAGLYAFGYTFVFRPLSLFSQSALQVLSQKIIQDYHQGLNIYSPLKKLVIRLFLTGLIPFTLLALLAPRLFALVFSEEYAQAGVMLQWLSPHLFMVFITAPLAFIPELFFRQKKAMIIDMIYLLLRFLALYTGITAQNPALTLGLFSAVSTLVVAYNLYWYLSLASGHQKHLKKHAS